MEMSAEVAITRMDRRRLSWPGQPQNALRPGLKNPRRTAPSGACGATERILAKLLRFSDLHVNLNALLLFFRVEGLPALPASLSMYDFDELRPATDALWEAIAARLTDRGIAAPPSLTRGPPLIDLWTDPALLLAQTCGYPLVTGLAGKVALLATPRYDAPGCEGTLYRSAIVVRATDPAATLADLRGRRCAVNNVDSNSGMNLLRAAIAPLADGGRFFGAIITTGGHAASVRAVAGGDADVAAIDCVTWAHLRHLRPYETRGLRVLGWTSATQGLPLITSLHTDAPTRNALLGALDDVARDPALAPVRSQLRLDGFGALTLGDYEPVLALERMAQAAGYPVLQ
jgi:ABC-type phosphate/phosphonate transport system substrate-binding protein